MHKLLLLAAILSVAAVCVPPVEASLCRNITTPPDLCTCRDGQTADNQTCSLCWCTADGPSDCYVDLGWLQGGESWVVDFYPSSYAYPPWYLLDCSADTIWEPPALNAPVPNRPHWIILDMQAPHRVYQVRVVQNGNGQHDIKDFVLEMSQVDPYVWEVVESSDTIVTGTSRPQYFGDFNLTSQYWRITMRSVVGWPVKIRDFCFFGHTEPEIKKKIAPCETLHSACILPTPAAGGTIAPGHEPPGDQPCYVTVDIHEGVRSPDNPLQVHRSGNVTINPLVSYECDIGYNVSLLILSDDVFPDKLKLVLPWKTMPLGLFMVQITVTMNVTELGHVSTGVAQTWLEVVPLPLAVMITPGYAARSIHGGEFNINADDSYDPDELVPSDEFHYNWSCEAVDYPDPPGMRLRLTQTYNGNNIWTLEEAPPDFPGIDWTNNITYISFFSINVKPNVFTVPGNYTIRLSNYLYAGYPRHAEYRFQVLPNPLPVRLLQGNSTDIPPDVCTVLPPEGASLVDKFCIVCEDFYDVLGPLRAEIRYEFIPDGVELATVKFPGSGPATVVQIILDIFSGWVLYTPMVDIPPGLIILELMVSSPDGRNTTVLLDPILITDKVAENMATVELQDFDGIVGLSTSTLLVTAFPDSVSGDAQVLSSTSLKSAFEKTREMSVNNSMSVGEVNRAAALMFTGAVNVFKASEVKAESEQEGGATSSNMLEAMHVRIKREDPGDWSEKLYTVGGQSDSFVRVPSFASLLPDGCPDGEVGVQVFQFYAKRNLSSMSFSVDFNSTLFPQPVNLWLSKHEPPTPAMYDWTATLPVPEDRLYSVPWINGTSLTSSPYQWLLPEEEVDITGFDVENKTEYYIGVQFDSDRDLGSGETVNFTLYAFETACVYFEENGTHLWQSDGCSVGVMSNITHIHCRCNHLTKFAGFVAPNPLNIQDALKANILENPIGLVLVLTVFSGYVMGIIWARKTDRKDIAKAGVAILPGHKLNPRRECQYVITVYTGFRGNAGTTAEITLVLYGIHYESPPLTLRDGNRVLFQQGSVDSFLVSTEQPLGVLTHMRVWHNNAGFSPSWFLGQIVVVNRRTNHSTYFLSNRWLAVDEDDGRIDRIIPTAGEEEMTKFRNVFFAKSSRDMNDGHLWFSIAGRPARSPFTRVQRLSCCLTLLYSTMVTNIMFFGRGDDFDPPEPLRIAGLEIDPPISLPQLMIGIQSAVIILPVNLLIVFLFRNSGSRAPKKSSSKETGSESDRRFLALLQGKPRGKKVFTSNNPDTPSFWYARDKSDPGKSSTDYKLSVLQSSMDHDVEGSPEKREDESDKSGMKSSLPWWAVFVGWLLVWSASFVAAFFTVLYTLSFGRAKAEAWVFTFVTSFFTDLFLVQPFKLMLVAMLFALIIKKPVEDEDPAPAPTEDDEEYIYSDTQSPDEERSTLPPDESVLAEARARSAEKRKRRSAVLEVVVFGLFVTAIMLMAYQERSPLAFYMTNNVKGQILEGDFSEIRDIPSFWSWVEDDLIPATRTAEWYNGQANPADNVLQDMLTHPLDAVQLRQVRLQPGQHCETPEEMRTFVPRCTVRHSTMTADTDDYTPGWVPVNDTLNSTDTVTCAPTVPPLTSTVSTPVTGAGCTIPLTTEETNTPWKYRFASLIGSFPYFGKHGTYLAGGYSTPLGNTRASSLRLAAFLKEHNWLDERSRAVFVELILYNPHANLFSAVTLVVEFTNLGAAYRGAEVVTERLIQNDAILLFALRAVLAVFLLFFAIKEAKSLFARPIEYLSEFWSWVELLVIAVGFSTLGVYFNAQGIIDEAAEQRTTSDSVFDLYKSAVNWFQVYTYLLAFLICCATLKLIRLLRFNSHVHALSMTIKKSSKPVLQFFFVAGIILMAFTQMGNLLFGTKLQDYKNMLTSLTSLCTMMLGAFDFHALVDGHYILGPLMFFSYQCMMQFVLLSMFMTIIMDVYAEESQDPNTEDLQMVGFIKETTSGAVGKANRTLSTVGKKDSTKTFRVYRPDLDYHRKFATVLRELNEISKQDK
ncbi:PREDICTED: uncharacterized protein LOC109478011 [Branchiostoma belcheri]|uniref:Uncharacterized protein LOC109478011 n=1 Tax=Branchiostoma belcheri TaxID=7741 RepID=A0A6P4ZZJ8_BRABE|nr:PREDICTED: uncharacterized protein LOC109478011 [Branchiostoma belcheri]